MVNCSNESCELRHPRPCKYILRRKVCKFDDTCIFEHRIITGPAIDEFQMLKLENAKLNEMLLSSQEELAKMKQNDNSSADISCQVVGKTEKENPINQNQQFRI